MLYLKCQGQVTSIDVDERIADKHINANTVHWEFCERWDGMVITAQFTQSGKTYDVLVDEVTKTTTLPNELVAGEVDISAFGEHPVSGVRITTIPVKKKIDKSGFVGDGETPIPPTPDLYAQLLEKVNKTAIPHIGANGNWWFDDWDSGVAATAEVDAARQAAVNEINRAAANQMLEIDNKFQNTMKDIPETYTELDADVKSLKDTIASEAHVSGAIVTTESAMSAKPKALTVDIPYTAGGIMAITMQHRRRNMLALTYDATSAGVTYTRNEDGSVHIAGNPTGNSRYGMWHGSYGVPSPLPPGQYEAYAWQEVNGEPKYTHYGFNVYEGTGSTKIATPEDGVTPFVTSDWKAARAITYLRTAQEVPYDNNVKFFIGVGSGHSFENWDAPVTDLDQVSVSFGSAVYGGTLDVVNQTFTSLYAADGTLLADPLVINVEANMPTLYDGANTIWCDVYGSTVHLTYAEDRLDSMEDRISDIETAIGSGTKEYFEAEAVATIDSVKNLLTEPCLVFPLLTDIHYKSSAEKPDLFDDSIENIKRIHKDIAYDFVLNLGDNTDGEAAQETTLVLAEYMIKRFREVGVPYYCAIGNHDTNYYNGNVFTLAQMYRGYISGTKDGAFNLATLGTDCYKDFDNLGIRLVVINANHNNRYEYSLDTAAWLTSDALNTDKIVLLAMHLSPIKTQNYSKENPANSDAIMAALQAFVSKGGTLIQLCGHSHADYHFVTPWLSVFSNCAKFAQADVTSDGLSQVTGYEGEILTPERVAGTASEDCWTVVVVRTQARKINFVRFGAGDDREFTF